MAQNLDIQAAKVLMAYLASGVEDQVVYQKFYLHSIVPHSTVIEIRSEVRVSSEIIHIIK
ncbi:hypothetical protein D1647_10555 [Alistipes sp. Z76]|uniref:hypothetical protein n=1 Tax=Bacteroides acidifaciens TaxID=85831 RepID=UPI001368585E|nr:hypothetical protein [Bacteroides acidifaciens]NBJ06612.1 hypothetical protein [Alistipes sp. Z76]NCE68705.1 hypothetical protein [Muribaculaceae bacterium M3]